MARRRAGSAGGVRSAAAHTRPVRRPAIAGIPASAKRAAASSSSSSGRVEDTITGTGLTAAPAWMPSRTAAHDSAAAPSIPTGWS